MSRFIFWSFLPVGEWRVRDLILNGKVFGQMISLLKKHPSIRKIGGWVNYSSAMLLT